MSMLLELCAVFFKIGLFSFGGGFAVLSFLQKEIASHGWMTQEQFVDLIAVSQSTPGPIAINMATFVGYQAGGIFGAVLATFSVMLPGMVLMVLLALFFLHIYEHPLATALFAGLRPAVAGLIAAAAWKIGGIAIVNEVTVVISIVCFLLLLRWRVNPLLLVAGSAVLGILFF